MLIVENSLADAGAQSRILAESEEFTKCAFRNEKLGFYRAEAIVDVIHVAQNQLSGILTDTISAVRQDPLNVLAMVESPITD
jgi:tRNA U34 5-carboxymethylaminomethyl modifying GTPase MnmE/TrmE